MLADVVFTFQILKHIYCIVLQFFKPFHSRRVIKHFAIFILCRGPKVINMEIYHKTWSKQYTNTYTTQTYTHRMQVRNTCTPYGYEYGCEYWYEYGVSEKYASWNSWNFLSLINVVRFIYIYMYSYQTNQDSETIKHFALLHGKTVESAIVKYYRFQIIL